MTSTNSGLTKPTLKYTAIILSNSGAFLAELTPSDNKDAICHVVDVINQECRGRIRAQVQVEGSGSVR